MKGFFITGTDTGVGKTAITAGLAGALKARDLNVGVMKPVQSGGVQTQSGLISPDAYAIKQATGCQEPINQINPYCFEAPVNPELAAQEAGQTIEKDIILSAYKKLASTHELMIVEGAGGILVPIAPNYLIADLAKDIGLPLIIVARPNLGTINHTLLTIEAVRARGLNIAGVVINGYPAEPDLAEKYNSQYIERYGKVRILGIVPASSAVRVDEGHLGNIVKLVAQHVDLEVLLNGTY